MRHAWKGDTCSRCAGKRKEVERMVTTKTRNTATLRVERVWLYDFGAGFRARKPVPQCTGAPVAAGGGA